VFVRDRSDKDKTIPCERNGPTGHHFSCDIVVGAASKVVSFRFTCRDTDYKFVMDKSYPLEADGKMRMLDGRLCFDPAITPYNAATAPTFPTIGDLLRNIKEVNNLLMGVSSPTAGAGAGGAAAGAGPRSQDVGVPATSNYTAYCS
jgi:hypothetical protein